jgi:uncharacterized protein (TIGR02271 family)
VPYGSDQIKDAPSAAAEDELSPEQEDEIYSYYGIQRSTATSPTGYAGGTSDFATGTTGIDTSATGQSEVEVPVSQEELQVGKREVEAGRVRLRKVVETEHQEVPVELRRERIDVERVPASGTEVPGDAFQEQEYEVQASREEPVVGKEARVTERVRVGKDVETEQRSVGADLRREDVEVEDDTGMVEDTEFEEQPIDTRPY